MSFFQFRCREYRILGSSSASLAMKGSRPREVSTTGWRRPRMHRLDPSSGTVYPSLTSSTSANRKSTRATNVPAFSNPSENSLAISASASSEASRSFSGSACTGDSMSNTAYKSFILSKVLTAEPTKLFARFASGSAMVFAILSTSKCP